MTVIPWVIIGLLILVIGILLLHLPKKKVVAMPPAPVAQSKVKCNIKTFYFSDGFTIAHHSVCNGDVPHMGDLEASAAYTYAKLESVIGTVHYI